MTHITPFCLTCEAFLPADAACPRCGTLRAAAAIPTAVGRPLWTAALPGAPALRPALARVDGRALLLLPWGNRDAGTGGVVALAAADGSLAWERPLGMPVEGGVAVAEAAGLAVVGLARRGPFPPGEGALVALDLRTGKEHWPQRFRTGGAVEAAPVTDDICAYGAADDGHLYRVDLASGAVAWRKPVADKPVRIPAPAALRSERGVTQAIVVATYGMTAWQDDGRLVAFNAAGQRLWSADPGGQVRGAPVVAHGRVYVAAYRGNPAVGLLSAFDLRTGRPAWPAPFAIPAPAGGRSDIVSSPLVVGETIYVGSHDHGLYAVDAATGKGRSVATVARGITSTPALAEGLVVFGANDGQVYAVDAATGERAWAYALGGHAQAATIAWGDALFAAADNGQVAALSWHGGRYAWAAARLAAQGRQVAAGDCLALAAYHSVRSDDQEQGYQRAAAAWEEAGAIEKAAHMWLWRGARWRRLAASAFHRAGLAHCRRDDGGAARYLKQAVDLYYRIYSTERLDADTEALAQALNEVTLALAECAGLPHVTARVENLNGLVQWEPSKLALRLTNQGRAAIRDEVRVALGGGFAELVEARLLGGLRPNGFWRVPVTAIAMQPSSLLEIEVEYDTGQPDFTPLRTLLLQPIKMAERPRPATVINIGDVGVLKLSTGQADDGSKVQVVTGDVGLFAARNAQIGSVDVRGDVGALVGADPVTRQQVADLSEALRWLGGRVQQLEAAPRGPEPATSEDLAALRADLAGHQAGIQGILARLTVEQQAALAGLVDQMRQVEGQLAVLSRAQAQASRPAAPPVPPPPPIDPATARWARRSDCVAQRIEVNDLPGYLARSLVIEPGVRAIFLEDGRAELGQVGPGHYALDTLLDRVPGMRGIRRTTALVFESGELALAFALPDLPCGDGRRVAAQVELCFRLTDGLAFFVNHMQGRQDVLRAELRDHLLPEVRDAIQEWLAPRRAAELTGNLAQKDALAAAVAEHLAGTLVTLGLHFERVRALAFQR